MHALRPRELIETYEYDNQYLANRPIPPTQIDKLTEFTQTDTSSTVLHACPGKRGVQIITSIQEHRTRLQLIREKLKRLLALCVIFGICPDGCG